jgi:biopolymer transport protein ExbB
MVATRPAPRSVPKRAPLRFSLVLTCALLGAPCAWAQTSAAPESTTPAAATPSPTVLRVRLAELQAEVAGERARQADERAQWERERAEGQARRAQRAEAVIAAQRRLDALAALRGPLERHRADVGAESAARREALASVQRQAGDLAEYLAVHLSELPDTDGEVRRLQRVSHLLRDAEAAPADVREALLDVLRTADRLHEEATTVGQRATRLWSARGVEEPATLLSAGHLSFAYRTDGGRVGLALSSPRDATGYRWSETLGEAQTAAVAGALDALRGGAAAFVALPLDVSGRLQAAVPPDEAGLGAWLRAGGPLMVPLALVAALALLLAAERAWTLYGRNGRFAARGEAVLERALADDLEAARALVWRSTGIVPRVLEACLAQLPRGQAAVEDAVEETLLRETPRLERFMNGLAVLAGVAPLLGLLGTVTGIIHTFGVIREVGNANPELMAGGISEALITTEAGLIIAVPILLLHGLFRGRLERLIATAEGHAATLVVRSAHIAPRSAHTAPHSAQAAPHSVQLTSHSA